MVTTIFFDVYGTLISTGTGSVQAVTKILKKAEIDLDPVMFYARWKKLHKAHMQVEFRREEDIFVQDLAVLYDEFGIKRKAKEDIEPMISSLYGRKAFSDVLPVWSRLQVKYNLILASNTDTEPLMKNLKDNHLEAHRIFTSESLQIYKPDARFYKEIMKQTGVAPEECVFVGDSLEEDVLAPERAGMQSVLLDRKNVNKENNGKYAVIHSLEELEYAFK